MMASDVMTCDVVSVSPDTPTGEIAKLLLDRKISAVPVVDGTGAPVGMVSEGDLIGRTEIDREARHDWWLTLFAEGETLNADFLASLRTRKRTARDIMAGPVITVGENTEVGEIARLLSAYRIKRVPVLRDGRIVGIVSRANLLQAIASEQPMPTPLPRGRLLADALAELDQHFFHRHHPGDEPGSLESPPEADETGLMVTDFQHLVTASKHEAVQHRAELRRAAAEKRQHKVAELIEHRISDTSWRGLLHQARQAAEQGQQELMLLRFPSELCSDGGRAINLTEPSWPSTLRGEAAEIYLRWERDMKPHGFHLTAQVLDFPGGMPGDIGLSLIWRQ
jgi:CBS domain-containing protein